MIAFDQHANIVMKSREGFLNITQQSLGKPTRQPHEHSTRASSRLINSSYQATTRRAPDF